jgi:NitT/TauT family transport system permease protein/sulfonate transport system permease protein
VSLELPRQIGLTLLRSFTGLSIALLIAVPLGVWTGYSPRASEFFTPTVEALRPIPPAAIIPLAITFLGIDNAMKVAVVVFGCLWPILLNTIAGVRALDRVLIETARTLNVRGVHFLWEIIMKGASPYIVTGVRISLAISLILTIVTEMIAGSNGLGFFIILSERSFRFADMYAGILAIGIVGYLTNRAFTAVVDGYLLRWYRGYTARL